MARLMPFLLVGLGGFAGSILRYALSLWITAGVGSRLPFATFCVNILGSFVLGGIGALIVEGRGARLEEMRLLLGVGFCGGFTTFSTYALENDALLAEGRVLTVALNVVLSPLLGMAAVRLGAQAMLALRG